MKNAPRPGEMLLFEDTIGARGRSWPERDRNVTENRELCAVPDANQKPIFGT